SLPRHGYLAPANGRRECESTARAGAGEPRAGARPREDGARGGDGRRDRTRESLVEQFGVVLLEDRREALARAGVQRVDQAVNARRHHEQVARRRRRWIPVGVRRAALYEQRSARGDRVLALAHAKAQLALHLLR